MTPDDTNNDTTDDALDPALLEAARHYHAPPAEVPREAMWSAIQAARASGSPRATHGPAGGIRARAPWRRAWAWRAPWPAAIAAGIVLAADIAIGRWSQASHGPRGVTAAAGPTLPIAARSAATPDGGAYQVAVVRDLTQAEALLTAYRTEGAPSPDHRANTELAGWARDVLSTTRLLLDSPAASDPQRRRLLEDLELVLVQMVELAPDRSGANRQMIDSTLEHDHVLSRLRYAVPAGATGI